MVGVAAGCTASSRRRKRTADITSLVFADCKSSYRDRNNVGRAFREVRAGTDFDWVKPHTYRKTVATLLDGS